MALDDAYQKQTDLAIADLAQRSQTHSARELVPSRSPTPQQPAHTDEAPWLGFWVLLVVCAVIAIGMMFAIPKPKHFALKVLRWLLFAVVVMCIFGGATSSRHGDIHYSIWIFSSGWPAFLGLLGWSLLIAFRRLRQRST